MRNDNKIYWWVVVATLLYVVFMLAACSPYKRLQDRKPKNNKEKVMLADACIENFPSKTDTVTQYITDTVELDNTDERNELNSIIDELILQKSKLEKDTARISELEERLAEALDDNCPPAKVVTKTVTQTITKPDAAKEFLLQTKIDSLTRENNILTYERDAAVKAKNTIEDKQESSITYNLLMAGKALLHKWWFYILAAVGILLINFKINPFPIFRNLISKFKK